jgi:hypothetical protein
MATRRTSSACCTLLLAMCAGAALAHPGPQTASDSPDVAKPAAAAQNAAAEEAPSYDSDYNAAMHLRGAAENTPEADGRPGEYYFQQGARAFAKKDYRFAIEMYQVAASWAYKPAEFNLGVMYARGQGVPADLPRAMAWMALAAERNDKRYVDAREAVYAALSKEQFEQANAIFRDLKKTYGDETALRRAKARWAEVRNNVTGSHVGFVGHVDVGSPPPSSGDPSAAKGAPGVHKTSMTSAEIFGGGEEVDGVTAYRQLRSSDNPYDPKFERQPLGTATVEPLVPVAPQAPATDKADPASK